MTTPDWGAKQYDGVGYPTPSFIPDETTCRSVNLPADGTWQATFMGLLLTLTDSAAWQQFDGAISADAAAARWLQMVDECYDAAPDGCGEAAMVDTPFWDETTGDDASAQAAPDDQTWFGQYDGETFAEALSFWAVNAFLAVSFTPQAAIQFTTPIRKFRLLLKGGINGGKVRVFVDDVLHAIVDTFLPSDGVIPLDVFSPGSTLIIQNTGDANEDATPDEDGHYACAIIKKELSEGEIGPTNLRLNEDTGIVQQTYDGGDTWVDNPQSDPRHIITQPPRTGSDVKCDSAENAVYAIHQAIDQWITLITDTATAEGVTAGVMALITLLFPFVGMILYALAALLGGILFEAGAAAVSAAFTTDVYDDLKAIIYCHMEDDGSVTTDGLAAIQADIDVFFTGVVNVALHQLFDTIGEAGITNAGRLGDQTGSCSGYICTWCDELVNTGNPSISGSYVFRTYEFTASPHLNLRKVKLAWAVYPNPGAVLHDGWVQLSLNGTAIQTYNLVNGVNSGEFDYDNGGDSDISTFKLEIKGWWTSGGAGYPTMDDLKIIYRRHARYGFSGSTPCTDGL